MSNKTNRELYLTTKCSPKIIEKTHLVTFNKIKKKIMKINKKDNELLTFSQNSIFREGQSEYLKS